MINFEETLTQETKTLVTIHRHIRLVQAMLKMIANRLTERADTHDISKLSRDEFAGFVEVNRIARLHPYGSEEYKQSLKDNQAIHLHLSRNNHHPEFYKNGVADMSLLDIIEMVIDWKAASLTYGNTSLSDALEVQRERFNLTGEQMYLINLIVSELDRL